MTLAGDTKPDSELEMANVVDGNDTTCYLAGIVSLHDKTKRGTHANTQEAHRGTDKNHTQ